MPFNTRTLRTMAWPALGLCVIVSCSSDDTSGNSAETSDRNQPSSISSRVRRPRWRREPTGSRSL